MRFHNEIFEFIDYIGPNPTESKQRMQFIDRVKSVIQEVHPEARWSVFGSIPTGLWLSKSDIDIVMLIEDSELSQKKIIRSTSTLLEELDWIKLCRIVKAKVPIIKIEEASTGLCMDISFNKMGGIEFGKMVKVFLKQYPELKYMVLLLKAFLK